MTTPTPHEHRLAEARQANANVKRMRVALDKAAANTAHADSLERVARDELATLEAERTQLIAAAGDELAAAIAKGMPDDVGVAHFAVDDQIRATAVRLSIRMDAAAKHRAIHLAALNGLRSAETALTLAVEELGYLKLEKDAIEAVEEFDRAAAKLERIRLAAGRGLDIPINVSKRIFPDKVRAALLRLPEPDRVHTPVNVLRGEVPHVDPWKELRAQILAELDQA